ncbi:MAG: hypothetical protein F6J87_09380 [Spirulina sp. SIO3F2]|nr:hypothetical protein [Spirulina sp. SIO3F2]
MSNTPPAFIHELQAVLEADKYEITPNQLLGESGITATAYARRKNLHYVLFDLQATAGDDLTKIGTAHTAACEWVDTFYKTPKSLRLQPPVIQTVFVTAVAFTRSQQEQVVEMLNQLDPNQGGEVRHASLVDLTRKAAVPLKDTQAYAAIPQQKSQVRLQNYAEQILGESTESASEGDALRSGPKTLIPPAWSWFFIVVNALMVGIGGAIPSGLGFGAAMWCYQLSMQREQPVGGRIVKCVGITLVAWAILAAIALFFASILNG